MTKTIESYPNIRNAYLLMESSNGNLHQGRSEEKACRETDPIIGSDGVTHDDLVIINEWLGTLSEDQLLKFVAGDEEENRKLIEAQGRAVKLADSLLDDLFNSELFQLPRLDAAAAAAGRRETMIEVKAMANVTEFLNKPYARLVLQEPDGSFSAEIVEFPGCIAGGETASDALDCLNEVAIDWIKAAIAQGQSIPEPMYAADYSGLRMPKSDLALKYRAKLAAAATNTASNKRIIEAALELKEFITCEDGCVYWWPSGNGAVAAHELRTLADYLDKRNAEAEAHIESAPSQQLDYLDMCNAEWESLIENDPLVSAEAKKERNHE